MDLDSLLFALDANFDEFLSSLNPNERQAVSNFLDANAQLGANKEDREKLLVGLMQLSVGVPALSRITQAPGKIPSPPSEKTPEVAQNMVQSLRDRERANSQNIQVATKTEKNKGDDQND